MKIQFLVWLLPCSIIFCTCKNIHAQTSSDWPSFRGEGGRGIADGFAIRTEWNAGADSKIQDGVKWQVPIPGLGHSSPVLVGDQIFLLTAVSKSGFAELKIGPGGEPNAANDNEEQSWLMLCFNKNSGEELWRSTLHEGKPQVTRHAKATHANTTLCIQGNRIIAFLGSEGLYCYDLNGVLQWKRDLGRINISKYGIGWGFASSPAVHKDKIAIVCDDPDNPYVALLRLEDGQDVWRVFRKGVCERSWGTPCIYSHADGIQVIINGWPWIVAYDFGSGREIWRIHGGGDNPVPTPFEASGNIYITSAHGADSPIYVVRPDARGDLSEHASNQGFVWKVQRGGAYMSTPIVYGGYLYLGNSNGTVRCFDAKSGNKVYEQRLDNGASIIASLVAGDGKIYCASEHGVVYVLSAGPEFKVLARNPMGEPCFATPAISEGHLYFRTTRRLIAINADK